MGNRDGFLDWALVQFFPKIDAINTPPLWHYTNGTALCSILTSNTIWSTHVSCLNDHSEISYWIRIVREAIKRRAIQSTIPHALELCSIVDSIFRDNNIYSNVFVSCFSEKKNDLSQWRGYCTKNSAFAIEFDGPKLANSSQTLGYRLAKVNYDYNYHLYCASHTAQKILETCIAISRDSHDGVEFPESKYLDYLSQCIREIYHIAPIFKHKDFHAEKEWRVVISNISPVIFNTLVVRQTDSMLSTHLPIAFRANDTTNILPISSVQLGPMRHTTQSKLGLHSLLIMNGYSHLQSLVSCSDTPYQSL